MSIKVYSYAQPSRQKQLQTIDLVSTPTKRLRFQEAQPENTDQFIKIRQNARDILFDNFNRRQGQLNSRRLQEAIDSLKNSLLTITNPKSRELTQLMIDELEQRLTDMFGEQEEVLAAEDITELETETGKTREELRDIAKDREPITEDEPMAEPTVEPTVEPVGEPPVYKPFPPLKVRPEEEQVFLQRLGKNIDSMGVVKLKAAIKGTSEQQYNRFKNKLSVSVAKINKTNLKSIKNEVHKILTDYYLKKPRGTNGEIIPDEGDLFLAGISLPPPTTLPEEEPEEELIGRRPPTGEIVEPKGENMREKVIDLLSQLARKYKESIMARIYLFFAGYLKATDTDEYLKNFDYGKNKTMEDYLELLNRRDIVDESIPAQVPQKYIGHIDNLRLQIIDHMKELMTTAGRPVSTAGPSAELSTPERYKNIVKSVIPTKFGRTGDPNKLYNAMFNYVDLKNRMITYWESMNKPNLRDMYNEFTTTWSETKDTIKSEELPAFEYWYNLMMTDIEKLLAPRSEPPPAKVPTPITTTEPPSAKVPLPEPQTMDSILDLLYKGRPTLESLGYSSEQIDEFVKNVENADPEDQNEIVEVANEVVSKGYSPDDSTLEDEEPTPEQQEGIPEKIISFQTAQQMKSELPLITQLSDQYYQKLEEELNLFQSVRTSSTGEIDMTDELRKWIIDNGVFKENTYITGRLAIADILIGAIKKEPEKGKKFISFTKSYISFVKQLAEGDDAVISKLEEMENFLN